MTVELKGKITIVPNDQLILVDGVAYECALSGGFIMRNGEWAVQFDMDLGVGEIEYTDLNNEKITRDVFDAAYGYWIGDVCQGALDLRELERETALELGGENDE